MNRAQHTNRWGAHWLFFFALSFFFACGGAATDPQPDTSLECLKDSHCDEQGPCFSGLCVEGACVYEGVAGADCDDNDACTEDSVCAQDGSCGGGTPVAVDNEPCASCSCDPEFGVQCSAVPVGQFCDDGDCCTTSEKCVACDPLDEDCNQAGRVCQGVPADCSDDNDCTQDSCDCSTGSTVCGHENLLDDSPCDLSSNDCTAQDSCQSGQCMPGDPLNLNDNNPCTYDFCDKGEVKHDPLLEGQCEDGDACTTNDSCQLGTCQGGEAVTCLVPECASSVFCDSESGCVVSWMPAGATCDDGIACTGATVCTEEHLCQGNETTCDDGKECTLDSCDSQTGECVYTPTLGACDDGNLCTGAGSCQADGSCAMGTFLDCSGVTASCIESICNPATGACDLVAQDGTPCPDGNLCNGIETCSSGLCSVPGTAVDCSGNSDPCLQDECNPQTGQCDLPAADGTVCGGDDLCAGASVCTGGACAPGNEAVDCSTVVDPCLEPICNPATGACDMPTAFGTPCALDTDPCTWDVCSSGLCTHPQRPGVVELLDQGVGIQARSILLREGGRVLVFGQQPTGTFMLVQTDGIGVVDWVRTDLGIPSTVQVRTMKGLSDGAIVLVGWDQAGVSGSSDGWLMHLDPMGQNGVSYNFGEDDQEAFRDVIVHDDDSLLLIGTWRESGQSALARKGWVVRTNSDFDVVWSQELGQLDATAHQLNRGVKAPGSPGYFLVGEHLFANKPSSWMIRIDDAGDVLWQDFQSHSILDQSWVDVAISGVTTPYFILAGEQSIGGTAAWFAGRTLPLGFDWELTEGQAMNGQLQVQRLIHHSIDGGGAVAVGTQDGNAWLGLLSASGDLVIPDWVADQPINGALIDLGQKTDLGFGLMATGSGRILFMDHDGELCTQAP